MADKENPTAKRHRTPGATGAASDHQGRETTRAHQGVAEGGAVQTTEKRRGGASPQIGVRWPQATLDAMQKAVDASPIEFQTVTDFIKFAVLQELRRRGVLKTFKE